VNRQVFINYRGEDTHSYGALLYTDLARRFGADQVFLDCESIPAGADFVTELLERVRSARVVLAVIGPRWLTVTGSTGRRIDDPADWIRRELVEAFTAGVRVIPVLTDHATLPTEAELPADIAALSRCQARPLRYREPTTDLTRIATDLTTLDPALDAITRRISGATHTPQSSTALPVAVSDAANTVAGDISGAVIQARDIIGGVHIHQPEPAPAAERVRVGVPPMLADRYQTRDLSTTLDQTVDAAGTVVLTQVLSGMGGVGKTQLAAHYSATYWPEPDLRLAVWISARSRDAILTGYTHAAADLLGTDRTDPDQAVARLLAWLAATDQRWLIVLDDLQHPEDLHHLWPPTNPNSHGQVVVTTRRRDPSLTRTDRALLNVDVFTPDEAESYLHAKLTDHPHLREGAAELAADLGPFPVRWTRREGRPVLRETQEWVRHAGLIPMSTRPTR
jgi:hypothetical protein